jgi:Flp pilus assembly protein TadD
MANPPANVTYPVAAYGAMGTARVALAQKDSDQARKALEPVVVQWPLFGPALRLLGQAYEQLGQDEKAADCIEMAGLCAPYVPPADACVDDLGRQSASATFLLKQMSVANRGRDTAWAEFLGRRAVTVNPDDRDAVSQLGRLLFDVGKADAVIQLLQAWLAQRPRDAEMLNLLATVLIRMGDMDQAERMLHRATDISPELSDAYNNIGIIARRRGQPKKAVEWLQKAIELAPNDSAAYENLGRAYLDLGQEEPARAAYARSAELKPASEASWAALAGIAASHGDYAQAAAYYRSAGRTAATMNNLAWLLATCPDGDVRNGAEALKLAARTCAITDYSNYSYLDTLAAAYAEAGQFDKAVETIGQAIVLAEQMEGAQTAGLRQRQAAYQSKRPWRS